MAEPCRHGYRRLTKAESTPTIIPQWEIAEGAGASGLPRLQAAHLNDQVHQKQRVTQLIERVTVPTDRLDIDFSLDGLMDLILELLADHPELVRTYRQLYSSARSHGL